jgi:hypothetical protein
LNVIEPDYVFNLCIFPLFIQTKNGESQRYANQRSAVPLTPKVFFFSTLAKVDMAKQCHRKMPKLKFNLWPITKAEAYY